MLTVNLLRRLQSNSVLKLERFSACFPSAILAVTLVLGLSQVTLATGLSAQQAPSTTNNPQTVDALETEMKELREKLARLSVTNLNDEANDLVSDVNSTDELQEDMQELQRQLALLAAEVERLRSGEQEEALTADQARALGVAPSAASIYEREDSGVSIAGYGEMLYENYADKTETGTTSAKGTKLDFLRHIFYMGYRFNDKFLFNSEVEIEHADEIYLEFAYVDYQVRDNLTLRGGMLLIPLGLVNEFHEPNVFMGARRPQIERRIIPTTWRENGVGILGTDPSGKFSYRAYVTNGFNGAKFSTSGLRGGRQKGRKTMASDMGFSGRLDFAPTPGVFFGAGLYRGGSDQGQFTVDGSTVDVATTIVEVHGQVQVRGFDLRAMGARASLDNAACLNKALEKSSSAGVAERMHGGYLQVGYDLLSQTNYTVGLTPYYRFEAINTQATLPSTWVADKAQDGTFHTIGVELKPVPNVILKADYEVIRNAKQSGRNQFNLNLGYAF